MDRHAHADPVIPGAVALACYFRQALFDDRGDLIICAVGEVESGLVLDDPA